jgi:hypothetical protein
MVNHTVTPTRFGHDLANATLGVASSTIHVTDIQPASPLRM